MKELEYPFSSEIILKKRKGIKRRLIAEKENSANRLIPVKVAILGGSTTNDIREMLELFLINTGINPEFYESEFGRYWETAVFDEGNLKAFAPDVIYIHTSQRNILEFPTMQDDEETVKSKLNITYKHFEDLWNSIRQKYGCLIIQNNFEMPFYRVLGNREAYDFHGKICFVNRLNEMFYEYADKNSEFYINDINYLSASYGLVKWSDPYYWYMYKYCIAIPAIPELAYNLSNIIKSIYGKNKKVLMLDLDNTLWGGSIGDDGAENIEIGEETATAQIYSEFQSYIKELKNLGILLTVNSKNDRENALKGLEHPDSILHEEDFTIIKANWEPKDQNALMIAEELNVGAESLVFVDDNPAERQIVREYIPNIGVPELGEPEHYIQILDRAGFFETVSFSNEDLLRNAMYKEENERRRLKDTFSDYGKYLDSLEMSAEIKSFSDIYISRIAQLTNKSNQFNLTTKRCTRAEIEKISKDNSYITLYGKLRDRFGDNGVVAVTYGHIDKIDPSVFHIDLWLMSCRVLKRDMEFAIMDELYHCCTIRNIKKIRGYYYPTEKNKIVKGFYMELGFKLLSDEQESGTVWELDITDGYKKKNKHIKVEAAL